MSFEYNTTLWPIEQILILKSSEYRLTCVQKHVKGHPYYCEDNCTIQRIKPYAVNVLPYKDSQILEKILSNTDVIKEKIFQVENGWLLDGHHCLAAAVETKIKYLKVHITTGVLQKQISYHRQILNRKIGKFNNFNSNNTTTLSSK